MKRAGHPGTLAVRALAAGLLLLAAGHARAQLFVTAEVFSLSTNARATNTIDLGNIRTGSGLHLLPYYIRVNYPSENLTAWGIQIYTNNTASRTWSSPNGVYGGLRGITDPVAALPLYWQVYSPFQDAAPTWGTPNSVTTTAGGLGFYPLVLPDDPGTLRYWGLVPDRNDQNLVSDWNNSDRLAQRSLVGYRGLGTYPIAGRPQNRPPVYVYLGMDVRSVTAQQQFGATVYLDLYNLGIDLNSGGFATPNPFTPAAGQRTFFNFYLPDADTPVKISIYTLRGRRIRTITSEQYWDGRDDRGGLVEGGLYIYQIETNRQRASGTVVVIK